MPFSSAALIALPFLAPWVAGPSVNVWQLLCTWACVAFLLFASDARGSAPSLRVLFWLLLCAGCIALFRSNATEYWLPACAVMATVALAAMVGARMSSTAEGAAALACGILAAGLISAILGLIQYYGFADPLVPWTTSPALGQAYGNLRQRNQFATLISMAWVAALWLYAVRPTTKERRALMAAALCSWSPRPPRPRARACCSCWRSSAWPASSPGASAKAGAPKQAPRHSCLPPPLLLLSIVPLYFVVAWTLPQLVAAARPWRRRKHAPAPEDRRTRRPRPADPLAQRAHLIASAPGPAGAGASSASRTTAPCTRARASSRSWTTRTTCRCTWRSNWAFLPRC
jgi:hypothetical protein